MNDKLTPKDIAELRQRLEDAEETLRAITSGEVDALVVNTKLGEQVFTLQGADTVYRIAIENINEGTITLSPEGTILYSNRYFAKMIKSGLNRIIGASIFDFIEPESRDLLAGLLTQESGRAEMLLRAGDDTQVPVYVATKQLKLDNLSVCAVITDLTQQKRSEELILAGEKLRESEERFRALVTASSEVLYRMSPDWTEMLQMHSRGFLAGKEKPSRTWLQEYIPADDQPLVTAAFNEAIRKKSIFELEHRVRRVDGSLGWTHSRAVPLMDTNGKIVEWFGAASDITRHKEIEERLAAQERLAYLGKMAGTIAHEVRNPLAVVDSSAYYLEKTLKDDDGKTKEHLRRIRGGVTRAAAIIEKLLEMSRMKKPQLMSIDLCRFVAEAVLATKMPETIKLASNKPEEELNIMADREQLQMALENILRNAVEAMPQGGTLTLTMRKVDSWAEFSVEDTGQGIPKESFPRLFEPLFTTKPSGVGFGLALAKTVVEKHGGKIEVKSPPGEGATFIIRLPLCVEGEAR